MHLCINFGRALAPLHAFKSPKMSKRPACTQLFEKNVQPAELGIRLIRASEVWKITFPLFFACFVRFPVGSVKDSCTKTTFHRFFLDANSEPFPGKQKRGEGIPMSESSPGVWLLNFNSDLVK